MKKVVVIGDITEEKRQEFLAIPDTNFLFLRAGEADADELKGASVIIGEVGAELLKEYLALDDESKTGKNGHKGHQKLFNKPIILASASPRRRELLTKADIPFVVMPADVEEKISSAVPAEAAEEVSFQKAEFVAEKLIKEKKDSFIVLSADTVVSVDGKILGKPRDEEDAFNALKELQGRDHEVYTGVTIGIKHPEKDVIYRQFHEKTRVRVYPISDEQIREYVSTGEPLDKAGSYAIQGVFAKYIKSIKGDYNNVVGLPVGRVFKELKQYT